MISPLEEAVNLQKSPHFTAQTCNFTVYKNHQSYKNSARMFYKNYSEFELNSINKLDFSEKMRNGRKSGWKAGGERLKSVQGR